MVEKDYSYIKNKSDAKLLRVVKRSLQACLVLVILDKNIENMKEKVLENHDRVRDIAGEQNFWASIQIAHLWVYQFKMQTS